MTSGRPHTFKLSTDELHTIQAALWYWEDLLRSERHKAKSDGRESDEQGYRAKIAKIRNLKARAFRVKTIA